jgi:FtsP/CotA-like multicopper oxidase with cupredoxin domain
LRKIKMARYLFAIVSLCLGTFCFGRKFIDRAALVSPNAFTEWKPYTTEIRIPDVVDMRSGGIVDIVMTNHEHYWGSGMDQLTKMYGFSINGKEPQFPGPTILTAKDVPISITWRNEITGNHVLHEYIDTDLLIPPTDCYPDCGVPVISHVHGMEVPASSDGQPYHAIYKGKSRTDTYPNAQMSSTHVYHDHAMGLTRLNHWSGLVGGYIIQDMASEFEAAIDCDIPLMITDTIIDADGKLLYATSPCSPVITNWAPESYGTINAVNGIVYPYLEIPQQQCRLR